MHYVTFCAPVTEVDVPGDANRRYKQSSNRARFSTTALVDWVLGVHKFGFSFDGAILSSDFGVSHRGFLKGERHLLQKVKKVKELTENMMRKDMQSVAVIIKIVIFGADQPNIEVEDLLRLLNNFSYAEIPLIRNHLCHESDNNKTACFIKAYDWLMVLKSMDPTKYNSIVNQIPYATDWVARVMDNIHLHSVLRYAPLPHQFRGIVYREAKALLLSEVLQYYQGAEGLF